MSYCDSVEVFIATIAHHKCEIVNKQFVDNTQSILQSSTDLLELLVGSV